MIRSNLPENGFPAAAIVLAYKGLSHAERGFRDIKSGDLDVRRSTANSEAIRPGIPI